MIVEVAGRKAVAVHADLPAARYACASTLTGSTAAVGAGTDTRLVVEIRRNLGGLIMRALVGGEFRAAAAGETRFEVCVDAVPFDSGSEPSCDSALGPPLIPGLPSDFAPATLAGLTAMARPLPPGVLRIDRAGHDLMGSSEAAFDLAARMLRVALSAGLAGEDVEAAIRDAYPSR